MSNKLKPDGKTYSPEQYHLYFRQRLLGATDYELPGGRVVTIPNSTAELDIEEFSEYMTAVEAFAADRGVFLDD